MHAPLSTWGLIYNRGLCLFVNHKAFLLLRHMWVSAFMFNYMGGKLEQHTMNAKQAVNFFY